MAMKIEKNVEYIGDKATEARRVAAAMVVGDSVFFEGARSSADPDVARLIAGVIRDGGKSSCRKLDGGVRLWRVS